MTKVSQHYWSRQVGKPIEMTESEYLEACDSYQGICLDCGELRDCTEPDAEGYDCPSCDGNNVQGIENALLCGNILFEAKR